MQTVRTRIESGKKFVKENALPFVTAAATVVTAVVVVKSNRTANQVLNSRDINMRRSQNVISQCIEEGRDFDYFPGLGVHVHAAKDNLTATAES